MDILFLTFGHVSEKRGGIDRVTDTLARIFIQKGHNVFMLSLLKPIAEDPVKHYQFFLPSQDIDSKENVDYLKTFLIEKQIDIIVLQSERILFMNLLVASHGNIPIVSVIHTDPKAPLKALTDIWDRWKYEQGRLRFYLKFPYYFLRRLYQKKTRANYLKYKYSFYCKNCAAVVLLSERFKKSFKENAEILSEDKLYAISNPFSTDISNIVSNKEKLILFVGHLDFAPKRLDRLFKIWGSIKDKQGWRICVLGDGDDRKMYEDMLEQWNLDDVELVGTVDPKSYYDKASILCVTSSHEGFSLAILEALQNGVIPIAFDSYEAVHDLLIDGYNGFIVPSFSTKEYRSILERLMSDEDLRMSIRKNIVEKNKKNEFNGNVIADKWIRLFEKIICVNSGLCEQSDFKKKEL